MKKTVFIAVSLMVSTIVTGQNKKVLDHDAYHLWRSIANSSISTNGDWVTYELKSNGEANPIVKLSDNQGNETLTYERGTSPSFTYDSEFLIYTIKPDLWEDKELRRVKTEEEDLPKDSLAILRLTDQQMTKFPGLVSVKVPRKWSGWVAYQYDPTIDTAIEASSDEEDVYPLIIKDLNSNRSFEYPAVESYVLAKEGPMIGFASAGDSTFQEGVYVFNTTTQELQPVFRSEGKYGSMAFDEAGSQFAFVADLDTTKALVRKWDLNYWKAGMDSSRTLVTALDEALNDKWLVNEYYRNNFSEDGNRLFFGLAEYPVVEDTTLLPEEIVNVEVWSYTDDRLHTQQEIEKKEDIEKAYVAVFHLAENKLTRLATDDIPDIKMGNEGKSDFAIGINRQPYLKSQSWKSETSSDLYAINVSNGATEQIATDIWWPARQSPDGQYAYWFDQSDTAWYTYSFAQEKSFKVTDNRQAPFFDEINDRPAYPQSYGVATWVEGDSKLLVYDRYDIWEVDPENRTAPKNLTNGRTGKSRYRYVRLDSEERYIKRGQKLLLRAFYEGDKHEAVFEYTYGRSSTPKKLWEGPYSIRSFKKAEDTDVLVFTRQNFDVFPDLQVTDLNFKKVTRISNANPQKEEYSWGTIELYNWTSLDGKELQGMLVKPEGFDPNKKYPMIVNFYEKSSDGLHRHRAPYPHRSTMNYSFYSSRGYVIFNPDVHYRTGYPGESAFNCVIPGVTSLIAEGFIDKENIGVQGHSWGGYQIAHLVTKTDIFKCAEAGAPVPNMISAYGGIRWGSGLSRMFQYEQTQSRIGGTLWEYPIRYIENSPIFFVDKINTPLLLMHNDNDGAVPWYQGIELFVALRRLDKPTWMLNYQGEPHWPLKLQNRIDFNIRLSQFFDYYLKDAPKPKWMESGVPAIEVGINQNLEYEVSDENDR